MADKCIRYGDRTLEMEPGMTLEQAREIMARHFPELADPKIETKKDGDKTTYVFSKKAGHKGCCHPKRNKSRRRRASDHALVLCQLQRTRESFGVDVRLVDFVVRGEGEHLLASDLASTTLAEAERVARIREHLLALPRASAPSGSVL